MLITYVREAAKDLDITCAIMQDLQGPRFRIGITKEIELTKGEEIILKITRLQTNSPSIGKKTKIIPIQLSVKVSFKHLKIGDAILADDGLLEFKVQKVKGHFIFCTVVTGGQLSPNKGINIPGIMITDTIITKKDKQDLQFGLKQGVDFVALSFVGQARDILQLKSFIDQHNSQKLPPQIIAKIETRSALENLDEIIEAADGVMVARGDLGLEIDVAKVPLVQRKIILKCLDVSKPVIVATQMLDSMIHHPRPTRAEVSDVAEAVVEQVDALLLSGETAFGDYPVLACQTMKQIIAKIEPSPYNDPIITSIEKHLLDDEAIGYSARSLVNQVKARLILATTISGRTAKMIARFRPQVPIVVTCEEECVARQLVLVYGLLPFVLPQCTSVDALLEAAVQKVKENNLVKTDDKIIIISGQPVGKGGANLLKVHTI
jgi:pyruvate kinase